MRHREQVAKEKRVLEDALEKQKQEAARHKADAEKQKELLEKEHKLLEQARKDHDQDKLRHDEAMRLLNEARKAHEEDCKKAAEEKAYILKLKADHAAERARDTQVMTEERIKLKAELIKMILLKC